MVVQELQLLELDERTVKESRTLFGVNRYVRFGEKERGLTIRTGRLPRTFGPAWWLTFAIGGESLIVELETLPDLGLFSADFAAIRPEKISPELQIVAFNVALESWIERLTVYFPSRPELVALSSVDQADKPGSQPIGFECYQKDRLNFVGSIRVAGQLRERLLELISLWPIEPVMLPDDLRIPVRFVIGETSLTSSQFTNLELGDVVFLDYTSTIHDEECLIFFGPKPFFTALLNGRSVTVKSISKITPELNATSHEKNGLKFDQIPVLLTFELGEQNILLTELQKVAPGYVFELARTIDEPVIISCNGISIGTGELVRVHNRLGVRIITLSTEAESSVESRDAVDVSPVEEPIPGPQQLPAGDHSLKTDEPEVSS
jgi:type III secretion system YscQ/HrcQ family protein